MISGVVTTDREPVIPLRLRGTGGLEVGVHALVDTGFSGTLALPETWIIALAWPLIGSDELFLADGSRLQADIHEGTIVWEGQDRVVFAHRVDAAPFVGMSLIWDHLLTLMAIDNGSVTIAPMP